MLRRLMVIPFDRRFTNEDKDPELFERIWANEMSGVLNRALTGYARLLKRRRFKLPPAVTAATEHWLRQANPLPAFLQERCVRNAGARCWIQDLYPAYRAWAEQAGYTLVQNQLTFRRNLENLGFQVSTRQSRSACSRSRLATLIGIFLQAVVRCNTVTWPGVSQEWPRPQCWCWSSPSDESDGDL